MGTHNSTTEVTPTTSTVNKNIQQQSTTIWAIFKFKMIQSVYYQYSTHSLYRNSRSFGKNPDCYAKKRKRSIEKRVSRKPYDVGDGARYRYQTINNSKRD